jgi:hypothetical protein
VAVAPGHRSGLLTGRPVLDADQHGLRCPDYPYLRTENKDMLLHLPITIMLGLPVIPVADSVPKFDIARECRSEVGEQVGIDRCVADENDARQQLQSLWTQSAARDQANCTQETTLDGSGSYVELLTCLEMSRDVKNMGR